LFCICFSATSNTAKSWETRSEWTLQSRLEEEIQAPSGRLFPWGNVLNPVRHVWNYGRDDDGH
jgi:hypothetical protein